MYSSSTSCSAATVVGLREAFFVEYRELVHGLAPFLGRSAPIRRDVAQRQPDELGCRVVAREVSASLDDLAQSAVHALDGIGCVDHSTHGGRERKEWNDAIPGAAPRRSDGGVLLAPGAAFELVQCLQRSL